MAKKIKVVEAAVTPTKPARMSRGCEYPWRVCILDISTGRYDDEDAYFTKAAAEKGAAEMPFGTYPVIVHIDIPPMPY